MSSYPTIPGNLGYRRDQRTAGVDRRLRFRPRRDWQCVFPGVAWLQYQRRRARVVAPPPPRPRMHGVPRLRLPLVWREGPFDGSSFFSSCLEGLFERNNGGRRRSRTHDKKGNPRAYSGDVECGTSPHFVDNSHGIGVVESTRRTGRPWRVCPRGSCWRGLGCKCLQKSPYYRTGNVEWLYGVGGKHTGNRGTLSVNRLRTTWSWCIDAVPRCCRVSNNEHRHN